MARCSGSPTSSSSGSLIMAARGKPLIVARACTSARSLARRQEHEQRHEHRAAGCCSVKHHRQSQEQRDPWPTPVPPRAWRARTARRSASSARSTRPPSMGNAGIRLNTQHDHVRPAAGTRAGTLLGARGDACSDVHATGPAPRSAIRFTAGTGERHHQLLAGLLRHALQAAPRRRSGSSTISRVRDAVAPRRERVPQLVQQHAGRMLSGRTTSGALERIAAPRGSRWIAMTPTLNSRKVTCSSAGCPRSCRCGWTSARAVSHTAGADGEFGYAARSRSPGSSSRRIVGAKENRRRRREALSASSSARLVVSGMDPQGVREQRDRLAGRGEPKHAEAAR